MILSHPSGHSGALRQVGNADYLADKYSDRPLYRSQAEQDASRAEGYDDDPEFRQSSLDRYTSDAHLRAMGAAMVREAQYGEGE